MFDFFRGEQGECAGYCGVGLGVQMKKKSLDFRSPEVGISASNSRVHAVASWVKCF